MTKKKDLKERQKIKKQQKREKEAIVEKYISRIKEVIEDGYLEMMNDLDKFNQELMKNTLEYSDLENTIMKIFKEEIDTDFVSEVNKRVEYIEAENEEIYKTITSRDVNSNKLLTQLPIMAENVSNVIKEAYNDLKNNKNRIYITSMITNRSFNVFKYYNSVIIDVALESNEYIDAYIDARESFVDFVEKCKIKVNKITMQEEIKQLEGTVKYKQRLRVDYCDIEKFLKYKGYECNRQGNTTHAVWKNKLTGKSIPVPNKSGTIPQGTASKILKQIESNRQELAEFLYA